MAILNEGDKVVYVKESGKYYTKDKIYTIGSIHLDSIKVTDNLGDNHKWDYQYFFRSFSLPDTLQVSQNEGIHMAPNKSVYDFTKLTKKMAETYERKNHDYGNSFDVSMDEEGLTAARIRLGDKWLRFKQLSKGEEALVKDESIRDTLLDMANYAIMTVMWIDNQRNSKVCKE